MPPPRSPSAFSSASRAARTNSRPGSRRTPRSPAGSAAAPAISRSTTAATNSAARPAKGTPWKISFPPTKPRHWESLRRILDDALAELDEPDYDALVLRFFQQQDFRSVGAALGVSDDTAQKRVARALEKLREHLAQRGHRTTAAALAAVIAANAVTAAPLGLAATISAAAVVTGTAVSTSTLIAATKIIAMTTLQKTLVIATVAVLAGAGIYQARQAAQLRDQNSTLQQERAPLAEQNQQLQKERAAATNRLAGLLADNARLKSNPNQNELLKLRGDVTRLQNEVNNPGEAAAKAWYARVEKLKQRLEEKPEAKIPELQFTDDEDWLAAVKERKLDTEVDYRRAASTLRRAGEEKFGSMVFEALKKYIEANGKQFPTDLAQLQPYFKTLVDDAILQRWEITPAKTVSNVGVGETIITQKAAVDELFDSRFVIGSNGSGSSDFLSSDVNNLIVPLYQKFMAENNGQSPSDQSQLLPYATTTAQKELLQKLMQRDFLSK